MQEALCGLFDTLGARHSLAVRAHGEAPYDLPIGDRVVRLHFAGDRLMQCLLMSLPGLPAAAEITPDFSVCLWEDPDFLDDSAYVRRMRAFPDKVSVSNMETTHLFYNPEGDIFCAVDTALKTAFYCVRDCRLLPDYEVCTPMRNLMHWMCFSFGLVFTHAAAVGSGGCGALLTGRSGAGKSTTALSCLVGGLSFAGDDYVALSAGEPIMAYGIYRGCKITDATLSWFGALSPCLIKTNKTQDKNVAILSPAAGRVVDRLPINAVIRPKIAGLTASRFAATSPLTPLMELATSTVLQSQGGGDYILSSLTAIGRRLPFFSLELSGDTAEISRAIGDFLSKGCETS